MTGTADDILGWLVTAPYVLLFLGLLSWGFRLPKKGSGWGFRLTKVGKMDDRIYSEIEKSH